MARLKRPLDRQAVKEADDKLYDNHKNDPRPNALFDAKGNRRPLSPNDPAQADLRREWVAQYNESLDDAEAADEEPPPEDTDASSERPVASPVEPCPNTHWIQIQVVPRPDLQARPAHWAPAGDNPYVSEIYSADITDGHHDGRLNSGAGVRFDAIPAGSCQIALNKFFQSVEQAFEQ